MTKTELFDQCEKHFYDAGISPLNKCQADYTQEVEFDDGSTWRVLRSYSTIVAAFSLRSNSVYVRDYYSATTVQHVYKFIVKMGARYGVDNIFYLYKRSDGIIARYYRATGQKVAQWRDFSNIVERDFKSIITTVENY